MEAIRFISSDPAQKAFASALKSRVNAYFKETGTSPKGDASLAFKTLVLLLLYLLPFVLLISISMNNWLALGMVILMGIGEAGVGMSVMHDGAHGATSEKKWLNQLCAGTMYLFGSNTLNWKIQHNHFHHNYTNIYGFDQDIATKAVIRLCEHAPLKPFHRFQAVYAFFFYGLMTLSKLVTDVGQLISYNKSGITRTHNANPTWELLKLLLVKLLYVMVFIGLPIWLGVFTWWQVLLGFCLMQITAGIIMSTVFQMAHVVGGALQPLPDKDGVIHNDWIVHQLSVTADFARNNRLLSWYIGGLNFQIEHHLFRNISHVHYPKIAPLIEQTAHEYGFSYNLQPSFWSALKAHYLRLKVLGRA